MLRKFEYNPISPDSITCIMIVYRLDLGESILCCLLRAESPGVTAGSIKKVNGLTNGEMCK